MADESVSIEVRDGVDKNIARNLSEISSQARGAYQNVSKLVAQLNRVKPTAIAQFNSVVSNAQRQMQQAAVSAERLATQQARTATASAQAATAQQRTAAATANADRAQTQAAASALRLEAAQARSAAAADKQAAAQRRAADAASAQARALKSNDVVVERMNGIEDRYQQVLARNPKYQHAAANASAKVAAQAKLTRHELNNLAFQVNDIAVGFASGQKPMTIFMQQGAQIGQIFGTSGVGLGAIFRQLAGIVGTLLARLLPFAAIVGAVLAPFSLFTRELNKGFDENKYLKGLKLTEEQLEKLKKSGESLSVTFGDTFKATFQVIGRYASAFFKPVTDKIVEWWNKALDWMMQALSTFTRAMLGLFLAIPGVVKAVFKDIPASLELMFKTGANNVISTVEMMLNTIAGAVANSPLAKLFGIDGAAEIKLPRLELSDAAKSVQTDITAALDNGFKAADKMVDKFAADVAAQARKNRDARVMAAAGEADKDRKKKSGGFDRAKELAQINAELDAQAKNMFVLSTARDAANRADEIALRFAKEGQPLRQAEIDAIRNKIQALNDAKEIQTQFDRIYQNATGPLREYNASLAAADKLLKMGAISQAQHTAEVARAKEAFASASDPLHDMNKELDEQIKLLGMLGPQREVEQQVMQAVNKALQEGKPLREAEIDDLREKLELVQQLNIASQIQDQLIQNSSANKLAGSQGQIDAIKALLANPNANFTQGDAANETISALQAMGINTQGFQTESDAFVEQWRTMYAQIDQLRQANLISEQEASAARTQLWVKSQEASLNAASNFFGQLSVLQKSENKKIAAIGKAAAISQAIIDTYKAATSAYASLAGIPYVGPALGAAAAAAAIAAGMANVAQIRSQPTGFMQGGYTGDFGRSTKAGDVHGREWVMNASATERIGTADLDALQRGAARVQRNADRTSDAGQQAKAGTSAAPAAAPAAPPQVNIRAITVFDPAAIGDYLATPDGEQVFVQTFRRNQDVILGGIQQ